MDHPGSSKKNREIAERLVGYETAPETPEATKSAADRVCEKLTRVLGKWVGIACTRALVARALSIEKQEMDATVSITDSGAFEGLNAKAAKVSPVLIAHLVGLVVTFLGEALTLRLIHEVWPDRTASDIHFGERSGDEPAQ